MKHFSDGWKRLGVSLMLLAGLALVSAVSAQEKKQEKKPAKKEAAAAPAPAPPPAPDYARALENLTWRNIGPAIMGGRVDDFAVVESNPSIVYVGMASGGIWKSVNGGTTWEPVFDNQAVSSIGDLALAPSDPSILYVGTGESNNRQSSSWGNGVYKTLDGGKTWQHHGLEKTRHIGRVLVHPRNPNIVYVAAAGDLWAPSKDRGVYKTTDGGKTWQQVLFINEDTGVNDIAMDWESPDTLYAGAYQRRRTVWGFNGGGPHGAIYKTTDGGATWKKLEKGLPYEKGGDTGRIGLQVYRKNPNIVYAIIEHKDGGVFRSEDKGETWTKMSSTNPRPMYYSKIHIDPNNDLRIWVLGAQLFYSEDGGKNFVTNRGQRIHGDYHAFWINPNNSDHMIVGTDGGIHWTWDAGRSWDFVNTIPLGQFYEIGVDMSKPYKICGGLQDNGSWCGPVATTYTRGISNDEWVNVAGGDGYYVQIDPTDPNILYAESQDGNVIRRNLKTGESKSIRPIEKEGDPRYRFQWNTPILISRHDPKTIYYAGQFVFKSTNRGDDWEKISPDLTNNEDRNQKPIMGRMPDRDMLSRFDGVQHWPCITTTSESPKNPLVLWAGTDDGNLQVTRDGGKTWKNVVGNIPGLPKGTYVTRVVASQHAEGTAYATFDGHRMGDFGIYVYATTDFGETWKDISSNLPRNNGVVNVIREHHRNPDLLFVGTEFGAYFSLDRGANWHKFKMNLPTVPVDDIVVHPRENDLIFGTHGRSIWVWDDITPLEQLNAKVIESDFTLFDTRPATSWRLWNHKASTGHKEYISPNPPNGALIHFYLKNAPAENERVRITILDKDGRTVREITCGGPPPTPPAGGGPGGGGGFGGFGALFAQQRCDAKAGINRAVWDLRAAPPVQLSQEQLQQLGFGAAAAARGPLVDPGEYTIKAAVIALPQAPAGQAEQAPAGPPGPRAQPTVKWEATKTLLVEEDPRVEMTAADRAARKDALAKLAQLGQGAVFAQRTIVGLRTSLTQAQEAWRRPGAQRIPEEIRKTADELLKKIDEVYPTFAQLPTEAPPLGDAGPPRVERPTPLPQRITQIAAQIDGWSAAPTATQLEWIPILQRQLQEASAKVQKLVQEDLANLNKMMRDAGLNFIHVQIAPGGGGRRGGEEDDFQP
jgi:photosystem II stability/assembly factor-like uncharacterized protein